MPHKNTRVSTAQIQATLESKPPAKCASKLIFAAGALVVGALSCATYWWAKQSSDDMPLGPYAPTCPPLGVAPSYNFSVINYLESFQDLVNFSTVVPSQIFNDTLLYFKNAVTRELPCLLGAAATKLLAEPLSRLKFVLTPPSVFSRVGQNGIHALTSYSYSGFHVGPYILLNAKPENIKEKANNFVFYLRNEMFHFFCLHANNLRTKGIVQSPHPFINKQGKIDVELRDKFKSAIEKFRARLSELEKLLKKNNLTQAEKMKLDEIKKRVEHYQPYVSSVKYSKQEFKEVTILKNDKGESILSQEQFNSEPVKDYLIKSIKESEDQVEVFYAELGNSKVEIFVKDWNMHYNFLNFHSNYNDRGENKNLTEIGSDLDSLDPQIKQYFAPEFCEYMSDYLKLPENVYCQGRNSLK